MSTATAEILKQVSHRDENEDKAPSPQEIIENARAGAARLLQMRPDELRDLISLRVQMLETELNEREERRAAIEEAMAAQRLLDARRQRARRIRRKVNIGSSVAAAMFTCLVVATMLPY